jgi:DNA-directed RNA polymerase subunit beta
MDPLQVNKVPSIQPLDFHQRPQVDEESLLDYSDNKKFRTILRDRILNAVQKSLPIENDRYILRATDIKYNGPETYTLDQQKKAILNKASLTHKLQGRWETVDKATGQVVSRTSPRTIMNVPYVTDRGTYIRRGTEYTVNKQFRLMPGVYSKKTDDGRVEAQFNTRPGTGRGFRIFMDPASSIFYIRRSGKKIPLLPVLKAMGQSEEAIKNTWGEEIYNTNMQTMRSPHAINFLKQYIPEKAEQPEEGHEKTAYDITRLDREKLIADFAGELDEQAVETTLGVRANQVNPNLMLQSTGKLLRINKGQEGNDERDSLEFQTIHDSSDFLAEKIKKDQNRVMRQILWKITNKNGDLDKLQPGILDKHVDHLFNNAGVAQAIEEINPVDYFDQGQRVTRFGEGAMTSVDVVPKEARDVQPSYMNFIDPIRSPESLKIGVDMRLAKNVRRGPNNMLYTKFINARTGKPEWVDARTAARSNIATAEYMNKKSRYVPSVTHKGTKSVKRGEVDYFVPSGDDMFSTVASTVPMKSGVKGMRLLMGSKFATAALPLAKREAPHVRTSADKGGADSIEKLLGKHMGAVRADQPGEVISVRPNGIKVKYADGSTKTHELYDNMPFARKTYLRNIARVKKGDYVKEGDLLAGSNYTNDKGVMALGTNLRTAYWGYDGKTFEDAIVISEGAAKKLTSEHMYTEDFEKDNDTELGRKKFMSIYPNKFSPQQMRNLDDKGVAKKGTVLNYGDPMVLAVTERKGSDTLGRRIRSDATKIWKHKFPGVVTDVTEGRKGFNLSVRANVPMMEGDKMSIRQGGKGVVAEIIPDDRMPRDAQGRPLEVIMSPHGIISRTNPSQLVEAQLGKVADLTGESYTLDGFSDEDMVEFAQNELKKHNLKDKEDVFDPRSGKTVNGIFTGNMYFYKQQHMAEGKGKVRSTAGYTEEDQPAKGGKTGAKHLGVMEIQALLGHGATEVLRDMKLVKGQKNDGFWRQMMLGQTPTAPKTPMVYEKFKNMIRAAGIQLHEGKNSDNIMAMTNEGAIELTGDRRIANANTYSQSGFKPMKGGLFDPTLTGSEGNGKRWSYIELPEPMINPLMADPIRHLLGMTNKELDATIRVGDLPNKLRRLDMNQLKEDAIDNIRNGSKAKRDKAIKTFRAIHAMEKQGTKPEDYMMTRIPVLPPKYRPITQSHGMNMVNDANYMYANMIHSINDFNDAQDLTGDIRDDARETMYKNYSALVGLTDPIQEELKNKRVSGILKNIFGKGSPKLGFVQRRVIGTNIDASGLAVITPNPALKLNQVGLPEERAFDLYEKFVVRNLVQSGMPAMSAAKAVLNKSKAAKEALEEVVSQRPVIINRAPTLHKYSVMAMWPKLTKGHTLQIPPALVGPFGADFDGDTMSYSVPVSKSAVDEAIEKMMPDKNLLSDADESANYVPGIEYLQGLYFLSKSPNKKKETIVFDTLQDAKRAYAKGEIKIDDPIKIKGG